MTQAPERIFAWPSGKYQGVSLAGGSTDKMVEYVRADLALPAASSHPLASDARRALEADDVYGWINSLTSAPAEDVRAGALREAAAYHESMAADEDALSAKYRGGSNPWFAHVQVAKWHRKHAAAILALIPEAKP